MTILSKTETELPSGATEQKITARIERLGIVESFLETAMDRETGGSVVCGESATLNGEWVRGIWGLHSALLDDDEAKVRELLS